MAMIIGSQSASGRGPPEAMYFNAMPLATIPTSPDGLYYTLYGPMVLAVLTSKSAVLRALVLRFLVLTFYASI
jgi:hypothetical protein